MCRSLVDKVARSQQLQAVAAPEVLTLFEDWMEELERELLTLMDETGEDDPARLASQVGLSRSGVHFLLTKLEREGKI